MKDIYPAVFTLPELTSLNLSKNSLAYLPDINEIQHSLTRLDLSSNYFEAIPSIVQNFPNLSYLNVSYNQELTSLPPWLATVDQLVDVRVEGLPHITDQLQGKSTEVFMKCMKVLYENSRRIYEMKMIITGLPHSGKSSFVRRLKDSIEVLTGTGISIYHWSHKLSTRSKEYEYIIWDISGCDDQVPGLQDVFFTPFALYIVAFDVTSLGKDINEIERKLSAISNRCTPSCVLLIATHCDLIENHKRNEVTEAANKLLSDLASNFPNLLFPDPVVQLVSSIDDNFDFRPIYDIIFKLSSMLHCSDKQQYMGRSVLLSAVGLKGEIEEYSRQVQKGINPPVILSKDFEEIVNNFKDAEVRNHDELSSISLFLNQVGCLLCFSDKEVETCPDSVPSSCVHFLKEVYVMEPNWLFNILRTIITKMAHPTYHGVYHRQELQKLLAENSSNDTEVSIDSILSVLVYFNLFVPLNEVWYINSSSLQEDNPVKPTVLPLSQQYEFNMVEKDWITFLTSVLINIIPLQEIVININGQLDNSNTASFAVWKNGVLWSNENNNISLLCSSTGENSLLRVSYTSESWSLVEGIAELVETHLHDAVVQFVCSTCIENSSNQPCVFMIQDILNAVISQEQTMKCEDGHDAYLSSVIPSFCFEPTHTVSQLMSELRGTHSQPKYRGRKVNVIQYHSITETVLRQLCLKSFALKNFNTPFITCKEGRLLALAINNNRAMLVFETPTIGKFSKETLSMIPTVYNSLVLCRIAVQLAKALLYISYCTLPSIGINFWSTDITSLVHCTVAVSDESLKKLAKSSAAIDTSLSTSTAAIDNSLSTWIRYMKNLYKLANSQDLPYMSKLFKKSPSSLSLESLIDIFSSVHIQLVSDIQYIHGLYPPIHATPTPYIGCASLNTIAELWMCSLSSNKTDIRISIYNLHKQSLKLLKVDNTPSDILTIKVCSDHIWLSTQLSSNAGCLSLFNASTKEFVHSVKMKDNFITCIEWIGDEVCAGTKAGFIFVFPADINSIKSTKPRHKFIGEGSITGLAAVNQLLCIAHTNHIFTFDIKEMKFVKSYISGGPADDLIGQLYLTSDSLRMYSVCYGSTIVREWSTIASRLLCTVNVQENIDSLQNGVITAFAVSLDTFWVGLNTGCILIYSSNEFITWVSPYSGPVNFLSSYFDGDSCTVISVGENYHSPLEIGQSDHSVCNKVLLTFKGYPKSTLRQMAALQDTKGDHLNSFESLSELLDGPYGFIDTGMIVKDDKTIDNNIYVQIPDIDEVVAIPIDIASTLDSLLLAIQEAAGNMEGYTLVYQYEMYNTLINVSTDDELASYFELPTKPFLTLIKL